MSSPPSKSPRHSLSERLQRSRRHRHWANTQLDSASVGGASVSSTGNVSSASEPPQSQTSARQRIKIKAANASQSASSSDNMSVISTSSTPSPEKRESLAFRRQRAMQLGKRRGQTPSHKGQSPTGPSPSPAAVAVAPPVPPKSHAFRPQETKARVPSEPQEKKFRSPAKQPSSPCESMLYQASTMDDSPEGNEFSNYDEAPELFQPPSASMKKGTNASPVVYPYHKPQQRPRPAEGTMRTPGKVQRSFPVPRNAAEVSPQPPAPPAPHQSATLARSKRNFAGSSPSYQPSQRTFEQPQKKPLTPVPPGAVIETPKVASVASLRASFNSRGSNMPIMPMNSNDPRIRHSLPMDKTPSKTTEGPKVTLEWSPAKHHSVSEKQPTWKSRPPSSNNSEPNDVSSPGPRQGRPPSPNRNASNTEEPAQSPPKSSTFAPRGSQNFPRQSSRSQNGQPLWQTQSREETEVEAEDPVQSQSEPRHDASQPIRKVSWQGRLVQDQAERKPSRASWQHGSQSQREDPPPTSKPSRQNRSQSQIDAPQSSRPSWQNRLQYPQDSPASNRPWQKDAAPAKSQSWKNRQHPDEIDEEGSIPQQHRDPPGLDGQEPREEKLRPSRSRQQHSGQKGSTLSPAILPQQVFTKKSLPPAILTQKVTPKSLPPAILPQKQPSKSLPPAILPQKQPVKSLPPAILPQKQPPARELPPAVLPMKDAPKKSLPPAILPVTAPPSQGPVPQPAVSQQGSPGEVAGPCATSEESQDGESTEMRKNKPEKDASLHESTSPSLDRQPTQKQIHKPPTYRPPAQSVQSQKSPWQKWSQQHSNQNKQAHAQTESKNKEWVSHEDECVEEKKSSFDEDAILDAAADEALGSKHTHLARMAADSTLIADYEEAIKQASRQMSYDEDDSYISGGFAGNSSAIPQELPFEFQQALSRSPVRTLENQNIQLSLTRSEDTKALHDLIIKESEDESLYIEEEEEEEIRRYVEGEQQRQHEVDVQEEERQLQNGLNDLEIYHDEYSQENIEGTPTTSQEGNRYPRLVPSPRDNDAYRIRYFGDESPASIRGKERRKSSPNKGNSGADSSPTHEQTSPLRDDWTGQEQDMRYSHDTARKAGSAQNQLDSPFFGNDYDRLHENGRFSQRDMINDHESSPGCEESSRDNSSRGQTSTLQGSYPDELLDTGRSREFESTYPDPDVMELRSDVQSDLLIGKPTTFGSAGGDGGDISPSMSITKRGRANEQWEDDREMHRPQERTSEISPDKNKAGASQILTFWSSGAASQEEQDEAIYFNETDQWLDRDPDLDGFRDDTSLSSDPQERPRIEVAPHANDHDVDALRGWRKSSPTSSSNKGVAGFDIIEPVTPNSSAWVAQDKFKEHKKSRRSGVKAKKDVFDPFGDTDELTIENSSDLFSPLPDPFMTEESFSPPDWNTPRGQISYHNSKSPDWHGVEI